MASMSFGADTEPLVAQQHTSPPRLPPSMAWAHQQAQSAGGDDIHRASSSISIVSSFNCNTQSTMKLAGTKHQRGTFSFFFLQDV
jgi:hypothetical protein